MWPDHWNKIAANAHARVNYSALAGAMHKQFRADKGKSTGSGDNGAHWEPHHGTGASWPSNIGA